MKNMNVTLFVVLLALFCGSYSTAQWVQTGPNGGSVRNLVVYHGDSLIAATNGGVFFSYPPYTGSSWSHSNCGLLDVDVYAVAATSTHVFAGTYNNGVYKNTFNGWIWSATSLTNERVNCLTVIGSHIFAGTYSDGVFLSTDEGSTWNQVNNGLNDTQVQCFAVSGTNLFAGTADTVYLSSDYGSNWIPVSNGLPNNGVISLAINGTNLFAGIWATGIYVSTNYGSSWEEFGAAPDPYVYSLVFNGANVFAGTSDGLYLTTDNGTDWSQLASDILGTETVCGLAVIGDNIIAATQDSSVYLSTNGGTSWVENHWGPTNYCVNGIAASNGIIYAASAGGLYASTVEGESWESENMSTLQYSTFDLSTVAAESHIVICGDVNGFVHFSTDDGSTWSNPVNVDSGATINNILFVQNGSTTNIFAAASPWSGNIAGGVYRSVDNAQTWTRTSNGLPTLADTNTQVYNLAVIGTNVFASTGHGIFLSTDNGLNWKKVKSTVSSVTGYLAVKGTELFTNDYNGISFSKDNGTTWKYVALGNDIIHTHIDVGVLAYAGTSLFAATSKGIYMMGTNDSTWYQVGLQNVNGVTGFTSDNGILFISTCYNSIWHTPISQLVTGIKVNTPNLPTGFSLSQNYPNPFNPTTTISYNIPTFSRVTLKVYDILGREIRTLVNEDKVPGSYEVRFNAEGLSSGIYLYNINAGKYSETKKLILMK